MHIHICVNAHSSGNIPKKKKLGEFSMIMNLLFLSWLAYVDCEGVRGGSQLVPTDPPNKCFQHPMVKTMCPTYNHQMFKTLRDGEVFLTLNQQPDGWGAQNDRSVG